MENIINPFDTASEWLEVNYGLKVGHVIKMVKPVTNMIIEDVTEPDNKGHFRTNYPVIIHTVNEKTGEKEKIRIYPLYGF